jgi:hypothetical protein
MRSGTYPCFQYCSVLHDSEINQIFLYLFQASKMQKDERRRILVILNWLIRRYVVTRLHMSPNFMPCLKMKN